ncbi:hypothetical protein FA15DRAFT_72713 [Coprinopsis marcescibilis]|uniref:Uncharacterized protein n=1 Tax=Coprinopsis marcescibilis TaxID=230819 RepID=A0A5C3KNZ9_COPMA|nr:hypothetical protein FA15DRAFT_72713 [Coprinopsis marcescibilis]
MQHSISHRPSSISSSVIIIIIIIIIIHTVVALVPPLEVQSCCRIGQYSDRRSQPTFSHSFGISFTLFFCLFLVSVCVDAYVIFPRLLYLGHLLYL